MPDRLATPSKAVLNAEFYTHRTMWRHAELLRELVVRNPDYQSTLYLSSVLVLHSALEAYLNYLGEKLFFEAWKAERVFFSQSQYKGVLGKVCYLAEQLKAPLEKGRRPFQTVKKITFLRHSVLHARTERLEKEVEFTDSNQLQNLKSRFLGELNDTFINKAYEDVEALCNVLQARAFELFRSSIYTPEPFHGIISQRGGSILRSGKREESAINPKTPEGAKAG